MSSIHFRATMALAFAALTAACGGGDGAGGPSFDDSVSTADAVAFGDGVADYAGWVASSMNFGGPSVGLAAPAAAARLLARPSMTAAAAFAARRPAPDFSALDWRTALSRVQGPQLAPAEGCTITAHGGYDIGGDPVDVNANDIPDDFGYRIECKMTDSTSAVDTVYTETVVQDVQVTENFASLYGMTIVYHVLERVENDHGDFQQIRYDVNGTIDIRSNKISDKATFKVEFTSSMTGVADNESAGESWNNAFTPVTPIALGGDIPNGALVVGGNRWFAEDNDVSLFFGVETTTPLAYSASCAAADSVPPFTAGVLKGKLNNSSSSASFTVTFTGCGGFDVTSSGTYDAVVVAAQP